MRASVAERFPEPCEQCGCDTHSFEEHLAAQIASTPTAANDVRRRPRLRAGILGMPELDAAIAAGHVRGELHLPLSPRGLGDWAVDHAADEAVVATAPVRFRAIEGGPIGVAVLIAKRMALPQLRLDEETREALAQALADSLLAGVL